MSHIGIQKSCSSPTEAHLKKTKVCLCKKGENAVKSLKVIKKQQNLLSLLLTMGLDEHEQ